MDIPRLGVKSELELWAYAAVTATSNPSHVCNLYHSSWICWILNPLSEAKDQIHLLMDTSQIRFPCATVGTPGTLISNLILIKARVISYMLQHFKNCEYCSHISWGNSMWNRIWVLVHSVTCDIESIQNYFLRKSLTSPDCGLMGKRKFCKLHNSSWAVELLPFLWTFELCSWPGCPFPTGRQPHSGSQVHVKLHSCSLFISWMCFFLIFLLLHL